MSAVEDNNSPWNFSWVVENKLAAMAWPQTPANLRFLLGQGIRHLITLSPEKRPPIQAFPEMEWSEIPIEEFEPPTVTQMREFIEICQRCIAADKPVGIHCRMGRGRTGTMAACYLVRFYDQSPERAITNIRMMRPGSVETYEQERAVIKYTDSLRSEETPSAVTPGAGDSSPPWNFSWVVENKLAAMAWPKTPANIRYLLAQGIRHLITLSPEKRPAIHAFPEMEWTEILIREFHSPTVTQIRKFIDVCQRCIAAEKPVGIHCRMGRGRTGTMAACYLVRFCHQSPEQAINNIRKMRPGSVETDEQERAVIKYNDSLRSDEL